MSAGFVVDASVGVAWVLPSQGSASTERLLSEVASGAAMVVPALWAFEVANSLVILVRRKRLRPDLYARARRALSRLKPVIDEDGLRIALTVTADLAVKHRLSVYDAAYLELAMRRGLPLASRDGAVNAAAARCGIQTLI